MNSLNNATPGIEPLVHDDRPVSVLPLDGDKIFALRNFLSTAQCQDLISFSEAIGYHDAPINTGAGFVVNKEVRNNRRVMVDDPALAAGLFQRARPFLPQRSHDATVTGLNERFRFYRYDRAETFAPHYDGAYQRANGEVSRFTFMIYLNEGFEGGDTVFYRYRTAEPLHVRPERGMALVFFHHQLHEGAPVRQGRKYVLRTDVMYTPDSLQSRDLSM